MICFRRILHVVKNVFSSLGDWAESSSVAVRFPQSSDDREKRRLSGHQVLHGRSHRWPQDPIMKNVQELTRLYRS